MTEQHALLEWPKVANNVVCIVRSPALWNRVFDYSGSCKRDFLNALGSCLSLGLAPEEWRLMRDKGTGCSLKYQWLTQVFCSGSTSKIGVLDEHRQEAQCITDRQDASPPTAAAYRNNSVVHTWQSPTAPCLELATHSTCTTQNSSCTWWHCVFCLLALKLIKDFRISL